MSVPNKAVWCVSMLLFSLTSLTYGLNSDGADTNVSEGNQRQPVAYAISSCNIFPQKADASENVHRLIQTGAKLIRYKLRFWNYDAKTDPLKANFTKHYKLDRWVRHASEHGNLLLSLAFNYDFLSLWLLSFDVEEVDIELRDSHKCMQYLPEEERYIKVRDLLLKDFVMDPQHTIPQGDAHSVCHQVIKVNKNDRANFTYECCHHDENNKVVCHTYTQNKWVDFMYNIFAFIKIMVLFCGPMLIQRCFSTEPINKADYVVPLKAEDHLHKTMLVKKLHMEDDSMMPNTHQQREMKQFRKFRQLVKAIPSDEIVSVTFQKLHLLIDHHKLMSEKKVPIGIFQYVFEKFVRCGICKVEPFASCCKESIIGTWGPKFLWFKIFEKSECNKGCRRYLSWARLSHIIGYLMLLVLLPLPYILRTICFYYHEKDEMKDRNNALERLNLTSVVAYNIFQYWTPTHGGLIIMYIIYATSFVFLVCIRQCDKESCDDHIRGAVQDMRGISYLECIRMLAAHLVLPFEKFGVCGVLVAALYWPFALPMCVLVIVCYCIPTVYMTGRLLLHGRPECLRLCPKPSTNATRHQTTLSDGTTSLEACLFLNKINPAGPQVESPTRHQDAHRVCGISKQSLSAATYTLLVGVLSILQMYSLLIMYAETVGFVVEAGMLILLGSIINATVTVRYLIFAFWVILYVAYSYKNVCNVYSRLSKSLFQYVKGELYDDLHRCVIMRHGQHKNTAFKLLSACQIRQKDRNALVYTDSLDDIPSVKPKHSKNTIQHRLIDTIDYQDGRLHWNVFGLIMFVDKDDTPRIPRSMFQKICELDAPGCPGPVHKVLGDVVKQLAVIVVYLILMFVLLMILEEVSPISTTNEFLLTVASGILPLLFLCVLKPNNEDITLNKYSFAGKVQQVIMEYNESWPVFDLSFTREYPGIECGPSADDDITPQSQASTLLVRRPQETLEKGRCSASPDIIDPTHVDLLITIRDDIDHEYLAGNLRSEPGSLGSHGSLNSGHRNSPDDPGTGNSHSHLSNPGSATGSNPGCTSTNKPTNANLSRTGEHGSAPGSAKRSTPPPQNTSGSPGGAKVDLVVDLAKGGLQVRGQTTQTENCRNGIPMWPVSSRYTLVNEKEPESTL